MVKSVSVTRRIMLAGSAALGAVTLPPFRLAAADLAILPCRANAPEEQLLELRRRIAATRWPERETVNDQPQGIQLAKIKPLVEYWGSGYDWRKAEAKLNALPQFVTNIDGLDIHFIHVRSPHPNAPPLIMTHGWPGSERGPVLRRGQSVCRGVLSARSPFATYET